MRKHLPLLLAVGAAAMAATQCSLAAQPGFIFSTDKLGYVGTVSVYQTLADAQNGAQIMAAPFVVSQRDAEIYVTHNHPSIAKNSNIFLTTIDYTTAANTNGFAKDDPTGDNYYSGLGNPNRTNNSFVQMYDAEGHTDIASSGGWTSGAFDTFTMTMDGAVPGSTTEHLGRFWNAGRPLGAEDTTIGDFVSWHLQVTATGLKGLDPDGDGFFEATNQPASVSGKFTGIFHNVSTSDPLSNGYYRFDLTLNDINWAISQGDAALNGNLRQSRFGAVSPVPEPASLAVLLLGGAAILRRRRS